MIKIVKDLKWKIEYERCKKERDKAEKKMVEIKLWTPHDYVQYGLYERIYLENTARCAEMLSLDKD